MTRKRTRPRVGMGMFLVLALTMFWSLEAISQGKGKGGGKPPKDEEPPPNPDSAIAFTAEKNFSREDLMVMNADGSNQTLVLEGAKSLGHHAPNWSPDGTQLVFISKIEGDGIYVINKDGTGLRKVVALNGPAHHFLGVAWSPVPSPDGQFKLAYGDQPQNPDGSLNPNLDLFLVNLDGTGRIQLTNTPELDEGAPTWAPLATRLAARVFDLVNDPAADSPDVVVYDLGLTPDNVVTVVSSTNLTASGPLSDAFVHNPDWAKTQDKLAVKADRDIWMIDLIDPANPVNLTKTPDLNDSWPSWSPDDSQIVFETLGDGIFVMNADGSGVTKIAQPKKNVFRFRELDWRRNP